MNYSYQISFKLPKYLILQPRFSNNAFISFHKSWVLSLPSNLRINDLVRIINANHNCSKSVTRLIEYCHDNVRLGTILHWMFRFWPIIVNPFHPDELDCNLLDIYILIVIYICIGNHLAFVIWCPILVTHYFVTSGRFTRRGDQDEMASNAMIARMLNDV